MKTTIIKGKRYIVRESPLIRRCLKCAFKGKDCTHINCLTFGKNSYYYQKDTWFNRLRTYLNL